jgi:hypothetical protein
MIGANTGDAVILLSEPRTSRYHIGRSAGPSSTTVPARNNARSEADVSPTRRKKDDSTDKPAPRRRTRATASTATEMAAPVDQPAANAYSRDEVARRAYLKYLSRGGQSGGALEDWLAAERELLGETASARQESA